MTRDAAGELSRPGARREAMAPFPGTPGQRAVGLAALVSGSWAVYLPGFAPVEYDQGVPVEMKVNKLTSVKTQLPYRYYTLPYCEPTGGIKEMQENLGETLTGDQIENSPYEIKVLINQSCTTLCTQKLSAEQKDKFRSMIEDEYLVNWIVDQLPAATRYKRKDGEYMYMDGFLVGLLQNGRYFVHNHVTLDLQFHSNPDLYEGYRIVGFEVEPRSSAAAAGGVAPCLAALSAFDLDAHEEVIYTYDVQWTESPIRWASR